MATIATIKPSGNFTPLSAGYHNGTLTSLEVKDYEQDNYNTGERETVTKLVIVFQSETDPPVNGGPAEGRRFLKLAYGPRAHLTIVRERLLGRALTQEEAVEVDDTEFLGKRIRVQIRQKTGRNGQVYGNLDPTSIVPIEDGGSQPAAAAPVADAATEDDVPF